MAAGLQLAGLSLHGHKDPAGFVAAFGGSHRYVLDYQTPRSIVQAFDAGHSPAGSGFLAA